jgi:type IV pilus assembly protein PilV
VFVMRNVARGFSLIEVLVALIIIGVGMLGLAKVQGLAYASTGSASQRSLAAMQTASLVSAMRANRAYWSAAATSTTPFLLNYSGTGITLGSGTDATMGVTAVCTLGGADAPCSDAKMAAYDVGAWLASLSTVLPSPTGNISCPVVIGTAPVSCTITVNWLESATGINKQSSQGTTVRNGPSYTLIVVP